MNIFRILFLSVAKLVGVIFGLVTLVIVGLVLLLPLCGILAVTCGLMGVFFHGVCSLFGLISTGAAICFMGFVAYLCCQKFRKYTKPSLWMTGVITASVMFAAGISWGVISALHEPIGMHD